MIQINPVHAPYPISWRYFLILSSYLYLGLPSGLFRWGFRNKILYASSPPLPQHVATYAARLIASIQKTIIWVTSATETRNPIFTSRQGVASQKTCALACTAMRTSNFAGIFLFYCLIQANPNYSAIELVPEMHPPRPGDKVVSPWLLTPISVSVPKLRMHRPVS